MALIKIPKEMGSTPSIVDGGNAIAITIDSSENVGIGTSSPSTKLHLGGTAPLDSIIRQDSTVSGTNWEIGEREAGKWQIFEDDSDSVVATFTSSGNVGIGNTAPPEMLTIGSTSDTNVRIQFLSSTTGGNTIHFGDGTSADAYRGYINYTHSDDKLAFAAGGGERLHIGSTGITTLISGQANLGTLQLSSQAATYQITGGNNLGYLGYKTGGYHRWFGSDGVEEMRLSADQLLIPGHATSGSSPIKIGSTGVTQYVDFVLQTNSGTGEIFKAGTGYTSWGGASALNIYNSNGNIAFHPSGTQNAVQMTSAGIVMGAGKGISFAANANASGMTSEVLDDYEEGSWTPTISHNDGTGVIPMTVVQANYVKIGNLVHLRCYLTSINPNGNAGGSGAYYGIRGMPFTVAGYGSWMLVYGSAGITSYGGYTSAASMYFMRASGSAPHGQAHVSGSVFNSYGSNVVLMMSTSYQVS